MYNEMDIDRIRGAVAYDQSGDRIGNVGEVYLDDQTGQPMWVTVNTGFFGLRTSFVPLEGSRFEDDDRLVLAHDKDRIKDAPNVDEDGHLDRAQEDELYSYYGVGSAAALGADQLRTRRWEDESVLGDRGVADDRSMFDRDGDGRGPVGEVLDGPDDARGRGQGYGDDRSMFDRDGDGRGPVGEVLDGPHGSVGDRRGDVGLDPHGGDAAYDRDVTYDRDRAYDDGPLLDSDRDGRGPIEEVLDGPDDPANPRRN